MKFEDLRNIKEVYNNFIADASDYNYDDVNQVLEDFNNYIMSIGVQAEVAQEIHEKVLTVGSTFEQQGFFYGMSKGINLLSEVELMEKRWLLYEQNNDATVGWYFI